jgi:hypothetical protein
MLRPPASTTNGASITASRTLKPDHCCTINPLPPKSRLSLAALLASAFVAGAAATLAPPPPPARAHIPTDQSPLFTAPQVALRRQQQEDLVRLFEGSPLKQQQPPLQRQQQQQQQQRRRPDNASGSASARPTAERAKNALAALQAASQAVDAGDFPLAEREYTRVVDDYGDLALSEYARFGQALLLYERGDATRAIAGLEDSALALTGRAEAHAALAALLYSERPNQLSRAELEFEVASEFDRRFEDADWVARERHWPPKAVAALRRFLALG